MAASRGSTQSGLRLCKKRLRNRTQQPDSRWQKLRQFTGQSVEIPTTLRIYPGANGAFTLYDDDGQSLSYRDGSDLKTIWIRFRWNDGERRLLIEPDSRMKKWPGGTRKFSVEVMQADSKPKLAEFRGEAISAVIK